MNRNFFPLANIINRNFFYPLGYCSNRIFFLKKLGTLLLSDFIVPMNRFNFVWIENIRWL
jgi:hypothetical protein